MMPREVGEHLVRAERVPREIDAAVAPLPRKGEICLNVLVRVGKALVPRADELLLSRVHIDGLYLPERIVRLCIEEIHARAVQRVADGIVERIRVEIPVNSREFP